MTVGATANEESDEKTSAVTAPRSSRWSPSYETPASSSSRRITASRSSRSVAKCRYTVRSLTPARAATARNVRARQSQVGRSCASADAPVRMRSRVSAI